MRAALLETRPVLSTARLAPPAIVVAVLGAHVALKTLFFWRPYVMQVALPLENATSGLITMPTLAGIIEAVVLVALLMVGLGRLRLRDIGLERSALRAALPVLALLWLVSQGLHASVGSMVGPVSWASGGPSIWWEIGQRLQAVVGSGLIEEVLYRGFLLVHLFGWLRHRASRDQALTAAIVLSSLYFGLNHIPAGLSAGMSAAGAIGFAGQVALGGALFAALYLRTGNLFLAAGAHALINDPVALVSARIDPSLAVLIVVSVLLLSWPWLADRLGPMFTVGTLEGRPAI